MLNFKKGRGFKWRWRQGSKNKKRKIREEREKKENSEQERLLTLQQLYTDDELDSPVVLGSGNPGRGFLSAENPEACGRCCLVAALDAAAVSLQRPLRRAAASRQDRDAVKILF